jgi:hypothetical protein
MTPVPTGVVLVESGVVVVGTEVVVVLDGALGVTAVEASDATEIPFVLVAVTVKVYAVPLVSPVTEAWVAPVVVDVWPPGLAVTS